MSGLHLAHRITTRFCSDPADRARSEHDVQTGNSRHLSLSKEQGYENGYNQMQSLTVATTPEVIEGMATETSTSQASRG